MVFSEVMETRHLLILFQLLFMFYWSFNFEKIKYEYKYEEMN